MAKKLYEEASVQAIADAIRAKNGSSDTYTVGDMATAIQNIPTGGGDILEVNDADYFTLSNYVSGFPPTTKRINIPEGVKKTTSYALQNQTLMEEVVFPSSFEDLGGNTFSNDGRIRKIIMKSIIPPTYESTSYSGIVGRCRTYVPDASVQNYKNSMSSLSSANYANLVTPISEISKSLIRKWDFASDTPLVDLYNGDLLSPTNIEISSGVANIGNSDNSYFRFPSSLKVFDNYEYDYVEIEIEIGEITNNNKARLCGFTNDVGGTSDAWLGIMYLGGTWNLYLAGTNSLNISDVSFFNNSKLKLKMEFPSNINTNINMSVFKDDTLIGSGSKGGLTNANNFEFELGSHRNTIRSTIKSITYKAWR